MWCKQAFTLCLKYAALWLTEVKFCAEYSTTKWFFHDKFHFLHVCLALQTEFYTEHSIVMSVSVRGSVCLFVYVREDISGKLKSEVRQRFCLYCPWPWLRLFRLTLARCGRSSNVQTRCHHALMLAWQGSAVPSGLLHTGHWCCRQAASQVSYTATDGGATTSAIHCWTPSIRCARPHGLELLAGRPPRTAGLWVI